MKTVSGHSRRPKQKGLSGMGTVCVKKRRGGAKAARRSLAQQLSQQSRAAGAAAAAGDAGSAGDGAAGASR